jgi:predicted nucleotidyltransferase
MSRAPQSLAQQKATELAGQFAAFSQVRALALGGSQSSGAADAGSDIDVYIYIETPVSLAAQAALIEQSGGATRAEVGLPYWGGVNMWIDATTGITVDCVYFGTTWMEEQVERVMEAH